MELTDGYPPLKAIHFRPRQRRPTCGGEAVSCLIQYVTDPLYQTPYGCGDVVAVCPPKVEAITAQRLIDDGAPALPRQLHLCISRAFQPDKEPIAELECPMAGPARGVYAHLCKIRQPAVNPSAPEVATQESQRTGVRVEIEVSVLNRILKSYPQLKINTPKEPNNHGHFGKVAATMKSEQIKELAIPQSGCLEDLEEANLRKQ